MRYRQRFASRGTANTRRTVMRRAALGSPSPTISSKSSIEDTALPRTDRPPITSAMRLASTMRPPGRYHCTPVGHSIDTEFLIARGRFWTELRHQIGQDFRPAVFRLALEAYLRVCAEGHIQRLRMVEGSGASRAAFFRA